MTPTRSSSTLSIEQLPNELLLEQLPDELLLKIFTFAADRRLTEVCKKWYFLITGDRQHQTKLAFDKLVKVLSADKIEEIYTNAPSSYLKTDSRYKPPSTTDEKIQAIAYHISKSDDIDSNLLQTHIGKDAFIREVRHDTLLRIAKLIGRERLEAIFARSLRELKKKDETKDKLSLQDKYDSLGEMQYRHFPLNKTLKHETGAFFNFKLYKSNESFLVDRSFYKLCSAVPEYSAESKRLFALKKQDKPRELLLTRSEVYEQLHKFVDATPPPANQQTLDLSEMCPIIPPEIQRFINLTELNLSGNPYLCITAHICSLKALTKLNLSEIVLTQLPNHLLELPRLTNLDISKNKLTALPSEIGNLASLKELDLSGNQLDCIPHEFIQLQQLEKLNLEDNHFEKKLPSLIYRLRSLTEIRFGKNKISEIHSEISLLTELKKLDLYNTPLCAIPPAITKMTWIEVLDLTRTQLSSLPESLKNFTLLRYIDLGYNKFEEFPSVLLKLRNLKILDLKSNKLTRLPKKISTLTQLTYLNVENNKLTSLPDGVGKLLNLQELYLNKNCLTKLPNISKLTSLNWLNLKDNKLSIDPEWINTLMAANMELKVHV